MNVHALLVEIRLKRRIIVILFSASNDVIEEYDSVSNTWTELTAKLAIAGPTMGFIKVN